MNVCDKQHIAAQARADYLVRPGAVLALIRLFTRIHRMYRVGLPIVSISLGLDTTCGVVVVLYYIVI